MVKFFIAPNREFCYLYPSALWWKMVEKPQTQNKLSAWTSLLILPVWLFPSLCPFHRAEAQRCLVSLGPRVTQQRSWDIPDSKSHSLNTQRMQTTHPAPGTFYILQRTKMLHLRPMVWHRHKDDNSLASFTDGNCLITHHFHRNDLCTAILNKV